MQKDMETWPFAVLEGPNGKPQIDVTLKGEKKRFFAEKCPP